TTTPPNELTKEVRHESVQTDRRRRRRPAHLRQPARRALQRRRLAADRSKHQQHPDRPRHQSGTGRGPPQRRRNARGGTDQRHQRARPDDLANRLRDPRRCVDPVTRPARVAIGHALLFVWQEVRPYHQGITMTITWNDSVPIYRQLHQRVVAMILDGALNEGDPLPSVRQVAADYQINPLTVSKAYQELVDEQRGEKRRGLGMFGSEGARDALLKSERERFLREDWPALYARLQRLGLDLKTLLREAGSHKGEQA